MRLEELRTSLGSDQNYSSLDSSQEPYGKYEGQYRPLGTVGAATFMYHIRSAQLLSKSK